MIPDQFFFPTIMTERMPPANGRFGDIYRGRFKDKNVRVKLIGGHVISGVSALKVLLFHSDIS